MLWTIRDEQLEEMKSARRRAFELVAASQLRKDFPQAAGLADEALVGLVRTAMSKGEEYDFHSTEDVFAYLELMILLGTTFDENPLYGETLRDFDLGSRTRLGLLVDQARIKMRRPRRGATAP
jgi:hypothetical protein